MAVHDTFLLVGYGPSVCIIVICFQCWAILLCEKILGMWVKKQVEWCLIEKKKEVKVVGLAKTTFNS